MALPVIIPIAIGALILGGCVKLAADAQKSRPLASLEGSEWAPQKSEISEQFVAFKSGGEIIGHGGCNNFFGQYTQDGTKLKIGALASTKKYCQDVMDAEAEFIQILQATRKTESTHKDLKLFGSDGELLIELQRRDWD